MGCQTMKIHESKVLNKLELHDMFANLKAYEFGLESRDGKNSITQMANALVATNIDPTFPKRSHSSSWAMMLCILFMNKFGKLLRKNQGIFQRFHKRSHHKKESFDEDN